MNTYAYIRVSTKEQNIYRQLVAIEPYKVMTNHIYCDYQSGKDFDRPEYKKLIRKIKEGDLLIIKSIDRLGRDYNVIIFEWRRITKDIKADIMVLDMEVLDTRNKDGNLTGTLIADLVLQILAYVAQKEREFIRQRQAEGIAAAKSKGKQFGRKQIDMPDEFDEFYRKWLRKEISTRKAGKILGISHSTFYRRCVKRQNCRDDCN